MENVSKKKERRKFSLSYFIGVSRPNSPKQKLRYDLIYL